jgi:mRNA interferase MazF
MVDFEPVRGSEASKRRPAVIVSNDGANTTASRLNRGVITVVPVTSNETRVYPLPSDSKAQAEQVRSITIERVGRRLGQLPPSLREDLDQALRLHLAL